MTTENTAALTEKEANKIFRDAFSDIHKSQGRIQNAYEAPSFESEEPAAPPVVETPPSTPAPTPAPEPAPAAPVTTPTPAPATEAPAAPVQKTAEEIIKSLPGEAQTIIQNILNERNLAEQRYRTTSGRLHKTRQEIAERTRELAELRTRASKPNDAVEAQAKVDHAKSIDEWRQVIEAEPTLAKAVDAFVNAKVGEVRSELTKLNENIGAREAADRDYQSEVTKQAEWDKLTAAVPNVGDVLQSQEYRHWISNVAPPYLRKMADESIDHRDALFVLGQFHPWAVGLDEHRRKQATPAEPSTPAATPAPPAQPTRADEIANQRNNRPVVPVTPGTPQLQVGADRGGAFTSREAVDDYFEQAYKKIKGK